MRAFVHFLLKYRTLVLLGLGVWLAVGTYTFLKLDIEAYPDPSPPLVEVITQNQDWSAEEMEQQVTAPVEATLNGTAHLQYIRSISIFGLSDVKMYFTFDSNYLQDRQEVLNRLQTLTLPAGLQPQLSPWSPTGEIFRFQLTGQGYSLNELKATADWLVRREVKQVPGIIDLTVFGGTTRQYQAEVDPRKLQQFNLTLPQVVAAVQSSNANAGGSYISLGSQDVNVRGLGQLHSDFATALYDAIYLGSERLATRDGRKVLVVVSDGDDTVQSTTYAQALEEALRSEVMIYSLIDVPIEASAGRDTGGEHALITLSEQTGGKHFYVGSGGLDAAFKQVSDDLRTQYLLGYYPHNQEPGRIFHRIKVTVPRASDADFDVRQKTGCYGDTRAKTN